MGDDGFLIEVAFVFVLVLVNAFFAGAEIAVVSSRVTRLRALAENGSKRAKAVLALKENPDRFLATVQIGVTVVGSLASAVGGVAAIERLEPIIASIPLPWLRPAAEPIAVGAVVFAIAYLSLVVGELVPKSLAVRHAERYALLVAPIIEWLSRFGRPLVSILEASSRALLRLLGQKNVDPVHLHSLDDLKAIAEEAGRQGVVRDEIVSGAVEFHERDVREVMTPRPRIHAISIGATIAGAIERIRETGHSRYPLFEGVIDEVVGFAYARDIYEAALTGGDVRLASLCRPALSVPGGKPATSLLSQMRGQGIHVALVVDEHGSLEGMVTLEDLLEVIVGEIRDEHHEGPARILAVGKALEVDGTVPVYELNNDHDCDLPESPSYVTVAGLVLESLGRIPEPGCEIVIPSARISVLTVEGHRISRLRIEKTVAPGH